MSDVQQVADKTVKNESLYSGDSELIYHLDDKPPLHEMLIGAVTHLLAIFVPMVAPALIVGTALGLSSEVTAYLVSMAMIASGIGTFIQVNRFGRVGSGLLSIQSVNFSFVTVMIALGGSMKKTGSTNRRLSPLYSVWPLSVLSWLLPRHRFFPISNA